MKQTAVDWLVEMWDKNQRFLNPKQIIEQAKAMEKEQITDAYIMGSYDMAEKQFKPEQYYSETYKKDNI